MPYSIISAPTAKDALDLINRYASTLRSFRVVCTLRYELADVQLLVWTNDLDTPKL